MTILANGSLESGADRGSAANKRLNGYVVFLEKYLVVPYVALVIITAEYARYLNYFSATKNLLIPRNILLVGLALVGLFVFLKLLARDLKITKNNWYWFVAPVFLGLVALIGLAVKSDEVARIYLTEFWLYGLFIVVALGLLLNSQRNLRWLMIALLIGLTGVIGIGVWEKIVDIHLPLSNLHNPYREQWALTSVFINQNHLAASLALSLPILSGLAIYWRGLLRWWSLLLIVAGLIVLIFTGSVLGVGAILVSATVFVLAWIVFTKKIKTKRGKWLTVATLVIGGSLLIWLAWSILPTDLQAKVAGAVAGLQESYQTRWQLIKNGWQLIKENPWLGLGPGGAEPAIDALDNTRVINLHNLFLEVGVNFGILALIVWLAWLVGLLVKNIKRAAKAANGLRWLYVGVSASLIGFVLSQAAPSSFIGVRAPFIVLGLALAAAAWGLQFRPKNG